jgi:alcohol dehydrogenase
MIITDQGVVQAGLLKPVQAALADGGITVGEVFDRTPPDSSLEVVCEIAELFRRSGCDCLLAVGGGSAIDTAKGANIVLSQGTDDLAACAGAEMLSGPMLPLIVVPTTAGTGSEATLVAVVADTKRNLKMLFTSQHLMPRVAVLDPRMTLTLPPRLTAATAMDALCHAMEAYYCLQKNPMSDAYAWQAIKLISANLRPAVTKGQNAQVRLALANAATMAGVAFSNSMVGMVHSLGHAAGAVSHVPHGEAMSILLPFGLEYNLGKAGDTIGEMLLPLGGAEAYAVTPESERPEKTIELVKQLRRDLKELCGLPTTMQEAGVSRDQLELIAQRTMDDGALAYNPTELDRERALEVLLAAY